MKTKPIYPDLAGKVALVSGGASGIGAAIVRHLHAQGSRVAFVDIDDRAARALCEELGAAPGVAPFYQRCDLTQLDQLHQAIAAVMELWGPVDVLVNNAAFDGRHSIASVTPDDWDRRMAINLRHYFFAIQGVLPGMAKQGAGSVINFSSTSWKIKNGNYPLYATAKAACHGMTRAMARDVGAMGVRINTVTPGWVMTEKQLALHLDEEGKRDIARNQCLPGPVMPDDLAAMVLFLASEASQMCTAQEFVVDGGWT
ncbi:SDR family oxidoreductase [Massilia terrae]|uniref:SDR family oxidoreductase n=1 Tax=Massilia terrae TaxID=1811224 RepID=A0ABT2CT48_9BURK|nr:SDR family oxidoreductase [Massilia terrae]MCS0657142.1 SDR family oxidoreductase [Massilia terrae]